MRIKRYQRSPDDSSRQRAEIAAAADGRGVDGRVCGAHCTTLCPHCGSSLCQCLCSPQCEQAAHALSSDPAFPIETGITPLVFEMKRSGFFEPCWSCEGHAKPDGTLWKAPTVWFYAQASAHVRLLASGLANASHRLSTPWRVVVTYSDPDNPETTYALEPAATLDGSPSLTALQGDAGAIALALRAWVKEEARGLQRGL